jgi:hypothetical protein
MSFAGLGLRWIRLESFLDQVEQLILWELGRGSKEGEDDAFVGDTEPFLTEALLNAVKSLAFPIGQLHARVHFLTSP